MIAIESFRMFKKRDFIAIFLLAFFWFTVSYFLDKYSGPQSSYIVSLLIATVFMSFTVHLVRKAGSATMFYLVGGLLTSNIGDLGAVGSNKIFILFLAGLLFESIFLIFKLELRNIQLDIVFGTAFSAAFIPLLTGLVLSIGVSITMFYALLNMVILSFLVGLAGSTLSFLIWYEIKSIKPILRFEYS